MKGTGVYLQTTLSLLTWTLLGRTFGKIIRIKRHKKKKKEEEEEEMSEGGGGHLFINRFPRTGIRLSKARK